MREWNGSVAFLTGGGQGIGLGLARALAKRGVKLALVDVNESALAAAETELSEKTDVMVIPLDVRDRQGFAEAANATEGKLGPVDLLVNNAGIAPAAPLATIGFEQWDLTVGINLLGVVNGLQTFLPRMIERGQGGYVLNTASGAGLVGGPNVLYTSTKHAVVGLSESLRLEADRYDIGVSVLCPGPVATQIISNTEVIAGDIPVTHRNHGELESSLSKGRSIDEVGEIVVAGIEARAMWIHTDDVVKPYVQMRMEALLESFPTPVGSAS